MRYLYHPGQMRDDSLGTATHCSLDDPDHDIEVKEDYDVNRDYENLNGNSVHGYSVNDNPDYAMVLDPVNRLLGTKLIQELNKPTSKGVDSNNPWTEQFSANPYGQNTKDKFTFLQSAFQRDKGGYKDVTMEGLNNCRDPQGFNFKPYTDGDGFCDETSPEEMRRMLTNKTFRSYNTDGNQIEYWKVAIQHRNYERNVDEAMNGFQFDGMQRGYGSDLDSLYCRIPQKTITCKDKIPPIRPKWNFWERDY